MDRYEVLKFVGRGAFGSVYKVYDNKEKHLVAVKRVLKKDKDAINEVKILKMLKGICRDYFVCYYDYMETKNYLIIVMEWLGGYVPLSKVQTIKDYCKLYANLANGLKLLHEEDIAHEDVKSDNIMVNPNTMDIKYIDFGLSCYDDNCLSGVSGTPLYVDPKLVKTDKKSRSFELYTQADLWSLGIVFYKLITNIYPMQRYKTIQEYYSKYDYKLDPLRGEINKFLSDLDCGISLDNLLSNTRKREYFT